MPEDNSKTAAVRSFWSGSIAFGLVRVPVDIYSAYRTKPVSLHMVSPDGIPLSRQYYCPRKNKPVSRDEIVRGYEVEEDKYVVVKDEELEKLEPKKSREIDLERFVKVSDINPMYFQHAYFLAPSGTGHKAYRLLTKTMEESGRAGIASFVMRGNPYLAAIISEGGILRAETLRYHDEIRSPQDAGLPDIEKAPQDKVKKMRKAMGKKSRKTFDPKILTDSFSKKVQKLARKKARSGKDVVSAEKVPEEARGGEIIDMMEVLKQSFKKKPASEEEGKENLKDKNKSELYKTAKKLDISGRSRMTKDELIKAIKKAS